LEISEHLFSLFTQWLGIEDGKTHFFIYAEQPTDDDWQINVSPHRVGSKTHGLASSIESSPEI
jgi:hypothetical protein